MKKILDDLKKNVSIETRITKRICKKTLLEAK